MENIKSGDLCVVKCNGEKICFVVDELTSNFVSGARVNLLQFRDDQKKFPWPKPESWAPYVKPKKVSALREQVNLCDARFVPDAQMRRFARYEISLDELNPSKAPFEIALSFDFALTLDDLFEAVRKIHDENDRIRLRKWAFGFYQFLLPSVKKTVDSAGVFYADAAVSQTPCKIVSKPDASDDLDDEDYEEDEEEETDELEERRSDFDSCFPTEESVLYDVCKRLLDFLRGYGFLCEVEEFQHFDPFIGLPKYRAIVGHIVRPLEICVENRDLPLVKRYYEENVKRNFIESAQNRLNMLNEDERALFVRFVDELSAEGWKEMMKIKARACYEGNVVYERDPFKARELLLELTKENDADPKCFAALGNICYEGSCNDGRPEYDKAFYYFTIAASGEDWKARLRLADMFRKGEYVPKNRDVYRRMIQKLYQEKFESLFKLCKLYDQILPGYYAGREIEDDFAEIALRVGDAWRDGFGVPQSWETALRYYRQAEYANDGFGTRIYGKEDADIPSGEIGNEVIDADDDSLYARIKRSIQDMEKRLPSNYFKEDEGYFKTERLEPFIKGTAPKDARFEARVKKLNDKKYLLQLQPSVKNGFDESFLLTFPQLKHCRFEYEIVLEVEPGTIELDFKGDYASFSFDEYNEKTGKFYANGKEVGEINAEFTYSWDVVFEDSKRKFVAVKFKSGYKTYDYLCDLDGVKAGDKVVVPTAHGEEIVEVQKVFERLDSELTLPLSAYKRVARKVDK